MLTYAGKILSTCSYSASNGGRTTSAQERWGGYRAWLIAKDDPWDLAATGGVKKGHGVGMSQAGASYAANTLGKGYMEILAFYYDGSTVIDQYGDGKPVGESNTPEIPETGGQHMIKAQDLCDYARKACGGGYCWGSSGETCS